MTLPPLVDAWTVMHVLLGAMVGFPFFWVKTRPLLWVIWILTAWEFFERCLAGAGWGDPGPMHGLFNGVVDVAAGLFGAVVVMAFLARVWRRVPPVVREAWA